MRTTSRRSPTTGASIPGSAHRREPVVVVGGYATTELALGGLARWLDGLGYDVVPFTTGYGIGCSTRAADALAARVRAVAAGADGPVHLVAHSRGGQFARVAALRLAAEGDVDLGGLVTLGTPFDVGVGDVSLRALAYATGILGSLGVPGLATVSCLHGRCCAAFRDAVTAPWPDHVPFTSVHGRRDALVPPRACTDPAARAVAVDTGHLGLLQSPDTLLVVAEAIAAHSRRTVPAATALRAG